jgi:hypothetical protein
MFCNSSPCANISQVFCALRLLLHCLLFVARSLLSPVYFLNSLSNWDFLSPPRFPKFLSFSLVWFVPALFFLSFNCFYLSRLCILLFCYFLLCLSLSFYFSSFSLLSLFWKNKRMLMRSPCCLCIPLLLFWRLWHHLAICMSVGLFMPRLMFLFSRRSVSYQRKVGDLFFPEFLVYI